jgi:hypothetical protein
MAFLFENEICGRCAGTGQHSFNARDGRVCFGCNGAGKRLTKRGAAAQAFYTASMTVSLSDLQVGDRVSHNGTVVVTEVGEVHQYGLTNGVPAIGRTLTLRNVKTGRVTQHTAPLTATFRKFFSAEITAERQAAALAYQASLTKAGKVAA